MELIPCSFHSVTLHFHKRNYFPKFSIEDNSLKVTTATCSTSILLKTEGSRFFPDSLISVACFRLISIWWPSLLCFSLQLLKFTAFLLVCANHQVFSLAQGETLRHEFDDAHHTLFHQRRKNFENVDRDVTAPWTLALARGSWSKSKWSTSSVWLSVHTQPCCIQRTSKMLRTVSGKIKTCKDGLRLTMPHLYSLHTG